MEAGLMSSAATARNPFPGLRPFKAEDSTLFFGRDDQTGEALDRLLRQKMLAVVGVSGCGKSSLVFAGMVPALEMGLAGDPEQRWCVATMRPGDGRCWSFGGAWISAAKRWRSARTACWRLWKRICPPARICC